MIRILSRLLLCYTLVLTACSKRERSKADEAEWDDIQPMATKTVAVPVLEKTETIPEVENPVVQTAKQEDYSELIRRLAEIKSLKRAAGEALITGETLILDYERRFVRMDQDVKVVDDHGELAAETLMGRFSADNKVEIIEARNGVQITSEGRKATAESATYAFQNGAIQLDGEAQVAEGGNRLSGEQIKFWIKGSRKMICEPNALLEITSTSGLNMEGVTQGEGSTEIRSDRLVYDEGKALAEFDGNVRMRDPRAAINCEKVRLHLKENNEIDWIEALSEVIIQSDDRKALADRANYYADEGKFVLEGDPKVKQGLSIMTGDRISFWQESQRMVCEPNARMLLYPTEEMKAKFLKDLKD